MKKRNIVIIVILALITFGLYSIFWYFMTRKEMVSRGADIPTAWLVFVPIVGFWWLYKFCMGVEKVSAGKMSGMTLFILFIIVGLVGMAFAQDTLNKVADYDMTYAPSFPQGGMQMGQPNTNIYPGNVMAQPPQNNFPPQQPPTNLPPA